MAKNIVGEVCVLIDGEFVPLVHRQAKCDDGGGVIRYTYAAIEELQNGTVIPAKAQEATTAAGLSIEDGKICVTYNVKGGDIMANVTKPIILDETGK